MTTRATQKMQIIAQDNVINKVLTRTGPMKMPFVLKLTRKFAMLRRIPARLIGMGFRPEHVRVKPAQLRD